MFKLVIIGGKKKGSEIFLKEGDNIIGRSDMCDHQLNLEGISKKHINITVHANSTFLEDMGSSNGTFVNGKIVKKIGIKSGDQIAIPNVIFKLVHLSDKQVLAETRKNTESQEDLDNLDLDKPQKSSSPIGKVLSFFRYKVMPIFYGFNEEYEWKMIFGLLLSIFIVATIALTIFPVLNENKKILFFEMAKRGAHYADDIARLNARALERKDLDQLNTNFLDQEDGVVGYELFDLEGRIVRPIGKLNQYINDSFSIEARDYFLIKNNDPSKTLKKFLDGGEIGIAKAVKAYDVRLGFEQVVGIIAIRFAPRSLAIEAANNSKAYLESLTTSAIVAILFFGIIYFLTIRPVDELRHQIDLVMRGRKKEITTKYLMAEMNPLRDTINTLLQRMRELQSEDKSEFQELESDDSYLQILNGFMQGSQGPVLILDSQKLIRYINTEGEDLLGLRENASAQMSLLDTARDQGFAATVIDLCDQCANAGGANQKTSYEISGKEYWINVVSLIGKDSFAKAFYITFIAES
ncbi:MAG: FHA domain-containing protein [Bacteriovoracaceae bacterium]|nr:FHA domain-containing protein [Bacteriovoracaceae bacterium]